jgi:ubiquinone/menaquinone biosynthesis C-methylase UbiE
VDYRIRQGKAKHANVKNNFMIQSSVDISFENDAFDFVFDMGCFHQLEIVDRSEFVKGVYGVLKKGGVTCSPASATKTGLRGTTSQKNS